MSDEQELPGQADKSRRSGRWLVVALVLLASLIGVYFAVAMPGMDHGTGSDMSGMPMSDSSSARRISPALFQTLAAESGVVVVNVHTPYAGQIEGTDLLMPFNAIDPSALPSSRSMLILVYCRTGNMSSVAVRQLRSLGYTNVMELDGGMDAWVASGRPLVE